MSEHRADDGSFSRSAGGAAVRGTALIAAAVLVGFLLLNANDDPAPSTGVAASATTTPTDDGEAAPAEDEGEGEAEGEGEGDAEQPAAAEPRPPGEVKVLVANGSDVKGAAGKVSDQLKTKGYNVLSATNTTSPASSAAVYYGAGFQAEARLVALELGVAVERVLPLPTPSPVDDARGTNVLVVLDNALASGTASTTTVAAGDEANDAGG
ncbi:MAG TPA: LytR C-terminal domain-containing protein [Acidimicrobiales bacterium]